MANQPKKYQKFVATAATATLVAAAIVPTASAAVFNDTASYDKETLAELDRAVELGFVKGFENGDFKPADYVTRGQVAKILARHIVAEAGYDTDLNGLKEYVAEFELSTGFSDVSEKRDSELYFASLIVKDAEVFTGNEKNQLLPEKNITRQQMAKVLVNAFGLEGTDEEVEIKDLDKATKEFQEYIVILAQNGVTKANPYKPGEAVKRIQMASFTVRAYDAADVTPPVTEAKIESAVAINKTTVQVTFNVELDKAEASNFSIEGGKVVSAELSKDKKTAVLDVTGLDYAKDYEVVAKDLLTDGKELPELKAKFTTPEVAQLWDLQVVPEKGSIEADGVDNTTVTFQLVDRITGEVDKNANDVVLSLNTTYGKLAQERATIQNGKATVVLRSEFNAKGVTAKVEAQIIEAAGDYKDLIGQVAGSANVQFVAPGSGAVDATYLTAANTNEADRVTLTFDKKVSVADFVETDANGKLTGELRKDNTVTVTQPNGKKLAVAGFLPGPTNQSLVAVLGEDNKKPEEQQVLTDNSDVKVNVVLQNASGQKTDSVQEFKFTDSRLPQVTSVNTTGMNKLTVKFSEPIHSADFLIDGFYNEKQGHFDVEYGTFKFDKNTKEFVDNRTVAKINLTDKYKENGKDAIAGYFSAGTHALQVSNIKDFAALTDANNIGSTQNLAFEVAQNNDLAVATPLVDSPHQYRVTFDKDAKVKDKDADIELQVYNEDTKTWVEAKAANHSKFKVDPVVKVTPIKGDTKIDQYKVEVTNKWTDIYDTAKTNNSYYNDRFRLVVKKQTLTTLANGKVNATEIELPLNYSGSALNTPDTTSPIINDVVAAPTLTEPGRYLVTMSEPVQEVNGKLASEVQFIGKDKDGKVRTFKGESQKYHEDGLDNKFYVSADIYSTETAKTEYQLIKDLVLAGGSEDWKLVLKDVTDDVGNKAATVTKDFKITAQQVAGKFEVQSQKDANGNIVSYSVEGNKGTTETVTITFTENVAVTGTGSAIDPANYTLNGLNLPAGTSIALAPGADGKPVENKVIITVKDGTLKDGSNVITLGKNLVSKADKPLTGAYAFTFTPNGTVVDDVKTAKEALDKAITDAKAVDITGKTAESVEAFNNALAAAEATSAKAEATKAELDKAKADLEAAKAGLKDETPTGDTVKAAEINFKVVEELDNTTTVSKRANELDAKFADKDLAIVFEGKEYKLTPNSMNNNILATSLPKVVDKATVDALDVKVSAK